MSARLGRRNEDGFTAAELTIVVMIAAIVSTALIGMLISQSNATNRVSRAADNQEALRQALIEVAKDVRSSDPILYQPDVTAYATTLPVRIRDISSDVDRNVRWRLDTAAHQLVREELDASATNVVTTSYRVSGITSIGVFTYYRADGTAYTLTGLDAGAIDRCAVRIHIKVTGAPQSGPAPSSVESDVQVRNRLPLPNEVWCTA